MNHETESSAAARARRIRVWPSAVAGGVLFFTLTACLIGGAAHPSEPAYATEYAGPIRVRLVNLGHVPVCYVYIAPTGARSMGQDWLGSNEVIQPSTSRDFGVRADSYSVRLEDCSHRVLTMRPAVAMMGPRRIVLHDGPVPPSPPADGMVELDWQIATPAPATVYVSGSPGPAPAPAGATSSGGFGSTSAAPTQAAPPPAPSGPASYSLDLNNECEHEVKLFVGTGTPPFGSGTYTSLDANTTSSYSGSVDEVIWIVDDDQHPISSYSPSAGSQDVNILAGCTGFARQ